MKLNGILILLFLVLQSFPCSAFAGGAGKYEDLKLYFPMNKGSVWIYDWGNSFYGIIKVTGCGKDDADTVFCIFETTHDIGLLKYSSYKYLGDAVIVHYDVKSNDGEIELGTPKTYLKSPLKVGAPVWGDFVQGEDEKDQNKVVKILPSMEVKAGKFNDVIKIEKKRVVKNKKNKWDEKMSSFYYYAPNVGLIAVGTKNKILMELVEYRPGE